MDNPHRNSEHLLLLSVIASACCSEIVNKRLGNSKEELTERMKIIHSMSEIYTSVYYIDIANDFYTELASVEKIHDHIGSSGKAQKKLNFFSHYMILPEFTDEMLEFVDISTLNERMNKSRIISKQFLCTIPIDESEEKPYWAQCSFIEGDRSSDGTLSHVIFVTQAIHESKIKELDAQKKIAGYKRGAYLPA